MNSRRIGLLLACLWVILTAANATAGSMHEHAHPAGISNGEPLHPHVHTAVSPFEAKLEDKHLHCELLGHNPLLPCPHHKVPAGEKDDCYLASECGGGPFQAPSTRSFGDSPRYLVPVVSVEDDLQFAVLFISQTVFYDPFYSHSLDRPPRVL